MDLIDKIQELGMQLPNRMAQVETEEATKNALVMPFIQSLGYDVFNPAEVVPEFTADVGTKRGEKVDYAIMKDGTPIMLFECKSANTNLNKVHASQLYRYFSVTNARVGILTNGIVYRFFSDLEQPNKMDERPFLVIDLLDIKKPLVQELKRFTKSAFDVEDILSAASELKYTREIKGLIGQQFTDPDEEFVRFFATKVYSGRMMQKVVDEFTVIVKQALSEYLRERVTKQLESAISADFDGDDIPDEAESEDEAEPETPKRKIITTEDELDGYFIVKSILREITEARRITIRDTKSYCGILLDDNNRQPICRLHFNRSQKYLGLFDEEKNEDRVPIDSVDDIYNYADRLKAMVIFYDQ